MITLQETNQLYANHPSDYISISLRRESKDKVDIGTQTRFSLNSQLIKDIDEMIKEQEVSESDDNSAGIIDHTIL